MFRRLMARRRLIRQHLAACERMASRWADGDDQVKARVWSDVHASAEALRSNLGR